MKHADLRQLAADTPSAWTPVPQKDGSVAIYAGVRKLATVEPEFAEIATFLVFARRYFDARTERELRALREVVLEAARVAKMQRDEHQRGLLVKLAAYLAGLTEEMEGSRDLSAFAPATLTAARKAVSALNLDLSRPVEWPEKIALARRLGLSVTTIPRLLTTLRKEGKGETK